ncbi:MAG: sodium-dependent transporter [Acidobacteria bacterium]|nr:MAG: sodium-dependent transporter [Acidobacteriota bacterium]
MKETDVQGEKQTVEGRGEWRSRVGFILAAAGSAIGLGNIWRFPAETARHGGAAFLVVYLGAVLLVGLPVMVAELAIGRRTRRNPVGAFLVLKERTPWWLVGALGVVTGVAILSFYSVVAGWTVGYLIKAARGDFTGVTSADQAGEIFTATVANGSWNMILHALFMVLTMVIVVGGIKKGIELASRIMMPVLLTLLAGLVVFSISLPGAEAGLRFYLQPDWSLLTPTVVIAGVGQAFFSLSLGMGAMITYGSYLGRRENLLTSAAWVAGMDTCIAFLAGLVIFPAFAAAGADLANLPSGAGLIFTVLPTIFSSMPWQPWGGVIFGSVFFLLLSLAALTSTISLLEVGVSWAVDELRWTRRKASLLLGAASFVLGIPAALANGGSDLFTRQHWLGMDFMSAMSTVFGTYSLTIGALLICVFAGWVWGVKPALAELGDGCTSPFVMRFWSLLVRYVCPLAILIILAQSLGAIEALMGLFQG